MATIANMPAADVRCIWEDGSESTVNVIVLNAELSHARSMARFGQPLAQNAPTLAQLRKKYPIERALTPNWARMAEYLGYLYEEVSERAQAQLAA